MRILLLLTVLATAVAGCASTANLTNQPVHLINSINVGDDKAKVIGMMGEPVQRAAAGNLEALQWCRTRTGMPDDFLLIWFRDGRVTETTAYRNDGRYTDCRDGVKGVTFRAPDKVEEIRYR